MNSDPVPTEVAKLSDSELQILVMLRGMRLGDRLEVDYHKYGELTWKLVQTHRGVHKVALPGDVDRV